MEKPATRARVTPKTNVAQLLGDYINSAPDMSRIPVQVTVEPDGIIATLDRYRETALEICGPLIMSNHNLAMLCIGLQCVCRLRVSEISMFEQAMIIQLIEGDTHLRAHDGKTYMYGPCGAWVPFKGAITKRA